jgi:hypothetical protein
MLSEGLLKPGATDLHILLSEFFEEIEKDDTFVITDDGKTSEKFEKYKSKILEIFSKYDDWRYLMSCINPENKVWRSISFFYSAIVKFLIDKCEDKTDVEILFCNASDLQAGLVSKLPKTDDVVAEIFCSDFSLMFVNRFAGALYK